MTHNYVYSTLAADVSYNHYVASEIVKSLIPGVAPKATQVPRIEKSVLIKGGAGVAPAGIRRLETPLGVSTPVTDDELELLEKNDVFQLHVKNGYITVRRKKVDAEIVVADGMESRDVSAPVTPEDGLAGDPHNKDKDGELKGKPTGRFAKSTLKTAIQ